MPRAEGLDLLLDGLPNAEGLASPEQFCVVGLVMPSKPGCIRVIVRDVCLTFDLADLLDVVLESDNPDISLPPIFRITLRSGARLMSIQFWAEFEHAASGVPRPFALATRSRTIVVPPDLDFRSREAVFFRSL
jgi:hypothetical protein